PVADPAKVADPPKPADPPKKADVPKAADPPKRVDPRKLADPPKAAAAPPQGAERPRPKLGGNPRVTLAAFDTIQWQMRSEDIERILGTGEPVDNSLVLHAMGSRPDDKREPYRRVEFGLWMEWQGKDHTIFVQFGGPNVVRHPDGS